MIWLWLQLASFTPESNITVRNILIPFASVEQCETALAGIRTETGTNIGVPSDVGGCVTSDDEDQLRRTTDAWPDRRSIEEKRATEQARLKASIEEAERFKAEYAKTHK